MRILMGIPFLYPAPAYGGASRAAYNLAEALHDLGEEVTVLTTDVWDDSSRFPETRFEAPFEIIRVPNFSNFMAYHWHFYTPLGILKHAERYLSQSDILHLHTFRNILNDLLARAAARQGIPYVLTSHGTIPRVERFFLLKKIYDLLMGKWQLANASAYIAVSRPEKRRLLRFGLPASKIRLIPNGVTQVPPQPIGAFRKRWDIRPEEKMVLFLGKISRQKGLHYLIRAFSRVRNYARLVIAGNDMGFSSYIRNLIFEYNLTDRVLWTGLLQDDQKFEAFTDADLTVYPSYHEAFGLVPLESILCGTPVVVCNDDGCGDIIRRTGGGDLVPWGDVAALTFMIEKRLRNGKDPRELQNAQDKILNRYDWHLIARHTLQLYRSVQASRVSPARIS